MKRPVIAFDVDGTLIDQYDSPRYEIVNLFLSLHQNTNCDLVIWSGGGLDYAEHWARKLDLFDKCKVLDKRSIKADVAIDDFPADDPWFAPTDLGIVNVKV